MDAKSRYDIISQIGQGDFAIVYKARDRELGREVAIKQIHQQYLTDPQQLEKFWREAQLLASLEHPNVMTIYDLVRPLGWLVLELMQGSLRDRTAGQPMNLDYLRLTLFHCLHALKFLHAHGIVHGDIKPGNMMLDKRNRVKIGDFGLARRAANAEGSLLKGTTKYMAPEMFVDHFGPVTPASDLYSLGFSAYELLCGQHFEQLFPGLNAFGRDKQLAWVMWHSAGDRRLPEICKVMEGVPPDLAHVIQKLCEKDPRQRYQTADQVLADLLTTPQMQPAPSKAEEEAAAAREAAARRRKRYMLIAALACSALLTLGVLFFPLGGTQAPPKPPPLAGQVRSVVLNERLLVVDVEGQPKPKELRIREDDDIRLNDKHVTLRELQPGDQVNIKAQVRDGRTIYVIVAARAETSRGYIKSIQPDEGHFTVDVDEGPDRGITLRLLADPETTAVLNGSAAKVPDLRAGDRVEVQHLPGDGVRIARHVSATRSVSLETGVVRNVDTARQELTLSLDGQAQLLVIPYRPDCVVTINKLRYLNDALVKPEAIQPGDKVLKLIRDTHVTQIDVYRTFTVSGTVRTVRVEEGTPAIDVSTGEMGEFLTFRVGPQCRVQLGAENVPLMDLHARDKVEITHDSPDQKNLDALAIVATRPVDLSRWALLIYVAAYDDQRVPAPPTAQRDARLLQETLVRRYGLDPEQAVVLSNPTRIRLEQDVASFLKKAESASQLLVAFCGHAFVEDEQVFLAPVNFELTNMAASGLPLKSFLNQLEQCPVKEKILFLDACQPVEQSLVAQQPSSAKMVELFKASVQAPALKTVTVIASCSQNQRPVVREGQPGVFAEAVAEALTGKGDKNRDNRLSSAELFEYALQRMGSVSVADGSKQTPALLLPNEDVPRLTAAARQELAAMLALLRRDKAEPADADAALRRAEALCGREPEPRLLHGLIMLKAKDYKQALSSLEAVKIAHPTVLDAHAGVVWSHLARPPGEAAVTALAELIEAVPRPRKAGQTYDDDTLALLRWAGGLWEYAVGQNDKLKGLGRLAAAAAAHGEPAQQAIAAGREEVRKKLDEFDIRILAAASEGEKQNLRLDRTRLSNYRSFNFEDAARRIQQGLEK